MRAVCVIVRNPLDPLRSREIAILRRRVRIRALAPRDVPVVAILNGRPVLRAEWRRKLAEGDQLVFAVLPAGGGGSNPLRTLMMIALAAFAQPLAGMLFSGIGGAAGVFATRLGAMGIMLLGAVAINALFPIPRPSQLPSPSPTYQLDAQGNYARLGAPIPVQYGRLLAYPDLAAQPYTEFAGNEQYLYQLLCLGAGEFEIEEIRIKDTPIDAFSEVETEVIPPGGAVTLFPTAVVTSDEVSGQELAGTKTGTYVKTGTTITVTETAHGRATGQMVMAIFPYAAPSAGWQTASPVAPGVITVTGPSGVGSGTVTGTWYEEIHDRTVTHQFSGTWVWSGTTITITAENVPEVSCSVTMTFVSLTGPSEVLPILTVPDDNSWTVTSALSIGTSGGVIIKSVMGGLSGFVAAPADTVTRYIGVDLVLPYGLFAGSSGTLKTKSLQVTIEARQIDDQGHPVGQWLTLGTRSITDRTNTPIRRSYRFAVAPGRYAVRAVRDDEKSTETSDGHVVLFAGLRAYLRSPQNFGPVTLIAVRMRATNNLSMQASRQIAVLATRKLPIWTGAGWTAPVATRSIAWAIADAARNADYGPGMDDAEIDLDALMDLASLWDSRDDRFDARFDQPGTWWDQIQKIARAGRSACFVQGGVLRIVRDGPASMPTLHFSERNILPGSFAIDYLMPTADTADTILASYFDSMSWSEQTVRCRIPSSRAPKAAKVQLFGVTGRDHAVRDGTYLAASNQRRRRIVRFDTEMEGRMPMIGELISVQHSMPAWGAQAEALAWDAATRSLTLSEPMTFEAVGVHYLGLRRPDGSLCGPIAVSAGADAYQLILGEIPDFDIATGAEMERTHVSFGAGSTWAALAKVADISAKSLTQYSIQAVIEDPSVHTAEDGVVAPPVVWSQLPSRATKPVVRGLIGRRSTDSATKAVFAWQPAAGADSYQIEMAEGDDPSGSEVTWTRVGDTTSAAYACDILYPNRTMIRVRAVGLTAGPWVATTLGTLIPDFWLSDSAPFWLGDTTPFWSN
ncbi:host specificity factor TipJ family phage tail protein [Rhodobacter capsulatus]|uniref:host specificity factor TipJ family phage tail protein n=1 Tax=Rhodobacter capsulatus TaxID=1061 RepID=UPI0040295E3C